MCKGLATLPATCLKSAKVIKHKISFLLQKPDPQAADHKQSNEESAAAESMPTASEVKKWEESFSHLMNSQKGRTVFGNFLRSEFSEENMDFWIACEDYKKCSPLELEIRAKQIYQQHVEANAPNEVNIDAATREETRQNVEKASLSSFNKAQQMIYNLMEKDSYRRFINSKLIQDLGQTQTTTAQEQNNKKKWDCTKNMEELTAGA
ncbi:regulator of G-protein signaling 4-like [Etheostoma cragini]|uniref:regulator of G-protein signaling 4-like n=1 Tax=Etheostoma cragini TaxID=417921 RepID=UPI00155E9EEC|nr:regulator of G-protein signaling 4-like [Etheostoma cragini]